MLLQILDAMRNAGLLQVADDGGQLDWIAVDFGRLAGEAGVRYEDDISVTLDARGGTDHR